jgi:hypothetical protein
MNDRSTINTGRPQWPGLSAAELRTEERKVFALLLLYTALVFFAIVSVKALDPHREKPQEPLTVGGTA